MSNYRQKTSEETIRAYQFLPSPVENRPRWLIVAVQMGVIEFHQNPPDSPYLLINTMTGTERVNPSDWIVKDKLGGLHQCSPEIFEQTYESI